MDKENDKFIYDPELSHGGYGSTLFDPRWKSKRKQILERDGKRCVICQATEKLQVHHRQYHFVNALNAFKDPWEYSDNLLITLCERCHQKGHRLYKVPIKNI